ncbi:MAG: RIP metalloprotease RseP [Candidatus Yanofskybacteria bacterium CG10_big_fil_rev_8_21_14_0_10_37_15]|uniref:Zinc metalloprotease n=1 Tax=Candidatus Yanofskybacteria bacterium CG10_big_fil_rev_8_21_14_0_10_37_15 TaxID=1975097 RepID=A0A2H0R5T5_9BACT|nr:MAG: RIP metalloprotease RseP [Candidatus Yanofskybacteria bacterium CG10_big_fil_rev_8_21_14_0_10_37_15]
MITALIFIIVIGVLIFVHEFGHFIFAKRSGMRVDEFGFGFPPRIWGIKKGETIYSINLIPFGGFVKILGEDGEEKNNPRSFGSKSFGAKIKVIVAGVLMNFFLAVFLLMAVNFMGLRIGVMDNDMANQIADKKIQIIQVSENSPAQEAGLSLLDEIKGFRINDLTSTVSTVGEVQNLIKQNSGKSIVVLLERSGKLLEKEIVARENPPEGEGALGISLALTGVVTYPWYESIWRGVYDAIMITVNVVIGYGLLFKSLIFEGRLIADVSGPIGIANLTGQAARIGFNYLIQFTALISINLAVLNIIPFPALDGGRAVLLVIEKFRGLPVNKKIEQSINTVGFLLLLSLMVYVTFKDIVRLF